MKIQNLLIKILEEICLKILILRKPSLRKRYLTVSRKISSFNGRIRRIYINRRLIEVIRINHYLLIQNEKISYFV